MPSLDGLLVVDKPAGPTSHDVVVRVRRALGERRIGHTGTLDPLATGVLPLLLGRATRLAQFLTAEDKRYLATIRLGVATTTYDREGQPVGAPVEPAGLTSVDLEHALDAFRGTFLQAPPAYSAKKVGGVSAHRLARRGEPAGLAPVAVTVHELRVVAFDGLDVAVDVQASSGFYVRSLAHDLGTALGCGAHLRALQRTAAGAFDLEASVPLSEIEIGGEAVFRHIKSMAVLLPAWPEVRLTAAGTAKVRHGMALGEADCKLWTPPPPDVPDDSGPGVRILDAGGALVALGAWQRVPGGQRVAFNRAESPRTETMRAPEGHHLLHPRVVLF